VIIPKKSGERSGENQVDIMRLSDHYWLRMNTKNSKEVILMYNGADSDYKDYMICRYGDMTVLRADVNAFCRVYKPVKPHLPLHNLKSTIEAQVIEDERYAKAIKLYPTRLRAYKKAIDRYNELNDKLTETLELYNLI